MKGKLQRIGQLLEAAEGKFVEMRGDLKGMKVNAQGFVKNVKRYGGYIANDGELNYEYEASLHESPKSGSKEIAYYKRGVVYGIPGDVRVKKIWAVICML